MVPVLLAQEGEGYVSTSFVVPKDGGVQPILNLKFVRRGQASGRPV